MRRESSVYDLAEIVIIGGILQAFRQYHSDGVYSFIGQRGRRLSAIAVYPFSFLVCTL